MDSVNDLKKDIIKSRAVVKEQQRQLKEKIDRGCWDDADVFFENPENAGYFYSEKKEPLKKNIWKRVGENLKKMIKKER